jgi:nitrile hydratase subunit alpha
LDIGQGRSMTAYDPKKAAEYHEEIHARVPNDAALRVKALESLLVEKGLVDSSAIDAWIEIYRDQVPEDWRSGRGSRLERRRLQGPTARRWDCRHQGIGHRGMGGWASQGR